MSLYPSLEDMTVHQYQRAQIAHPVLSRSASSASYCPMAGVVGSGGYQRVSETTPAMANSSAASIASAYPSLMDEYMGLKLEPPSGPIGAGAVLAVQHQSGVVVQGQTAMVAPLTSQSLGLARANVTHGVRQVQVCKDQKGKVGMRFRAVNKGIFVQFVAAGSPAALVGLRFGDQILQVDGADVVGMSHDKAMDLMTKSKNPQQITLTVRDRPFERTITLHKDSSGHAGFEHRDNQRVAIAKQTSAARNGVLIDHHILEVNGQSVIGMKNKEVAGIISAAGQTITLTIMPSALYEHMIKCMDFSLIKKKQDHSIPEV